MGTLKLDDKEWVVSADPHVTMMLRRVFPRVRKGQHGAITLTNTEETCRNLVWFMDRYPLDLSEQDRFVLHARADTHRAREQQVAARVLLLSLRAGAGIDGLQRVCQVGVFAELDWSPKVHEQDEGRLCRDGQAEATCFYYLVANEGSDPVVLDVLSIKTGQADGIVDPDQDAVGAQVDPDRIRRLAESVLHGHTQAGRAI